MLWQHRVTLHRHSWFYLHYIYKRYKPKPSCSSAQLALLSHSSLAVHPQIPMPRQELVCDTALLSLHFAERHFQSRQGWIQSWALRGGKEASNPSPPSIKHSRSWGAREQKGTEFGRGRCCCRREEEQLCPAQLEHFLALLESTRVIHF